VFGIEKRRHLTAPLSKRASHGPFCG
jgi:hypothetical protein